MSNSYDGCQLPICPLCEERYEGKITEDPETRVCTRCLEDLARMSDCCSARIIDYTFCSECKERCGSAGVTDVLYTNEMV